MFTCVLHVYMVVYRVVQDTAYTMPYGIWYNDVQQPVHVRIYARAIQPRLSCCLLGRMASEENHAHEGPTRILTESLSSSASGPLCKVVDLGAESELSSSSRVMCLHKSASV